MNSFVVGAIIAVLAALLLGAAFFTGKSDVAGDCRKFGTAHVGTTEITCTVKDAK